MNDHVFVARERELAKLDAFLGRAVAGQGQVCFVSGEPGSGKTALLHQFARRAQARDQALITATGNCNAQTGIGEAFLPCREVLDILTGGTSEAVPSDAGSAENDLRVRKILAKSGRMLLEVGPALIGTLIPAATLAALAIKLGKVVVDQIKLADKFDELAKRKPATPQMGKPEIDQAHIFEQYTDFLRTFAAEQPLLLIFDDLHWADASSLSLLFHLGRRIEKSQIMIIGAYRPEETGVTQVGMELPLEKLVSELKRYYGDITIAIDEEDEATTRAFVDACVDVEPNRLGFDFRAALRSHTAGNPLFITELMRHLQDSGELVKDAQGEWVQSGPVDWTAVPARVEGVIEERLQRLGKDGRATLSIASVEGANFTAEVVARLQASDEREMVRRLSSELSKQHRLIEALDVLRVGSKRLSRYRFHHSVVQKYLYDSLDKVELSYLHEDVGNALEMFYAEHLDDVAVELAWHFSCAGVDAKSARYHRRAGELAVSRYAHKEAIDHFTAALALTPETDAAARCELLLARETVYDWLGLRDEQARDLETLEKCAPAQVALRRAEHARLTGNYAAALAFVEQAVNAASAAGDLVSEAKAYATWGRILLNQGLYQEAPDWLEMAAASGERAGSPAITAQATYDLGNAAYLGGKYVVALDHFTRALDGYRKLGDTRGQVNALLMIGTVRGYQGDHTGAHQSLTEALTLCRSIGWRHGESYILGNLGSALLELGDFQAARNYHQQALAICREVQDREGESVSLESLGLVQLRLGDTTGAIELFHQALPIQEAIGYRRGVGFTLTHLGHALADSGALDDAAQAFARALAARRELDPESPLAVDDLAGQARVALAQNDAARAGQFAREALAWIDSHGETGIECPTQAYLVCFQALSAAAGNDQVALSRAREVLHRGQVYLEAQAARIQDPALRRSYRENIPFNRDLAHAS
jgi:adenylate cyclase